MIQNYICTFLRKIIVAIKKKKYGPIPTTGWPIGYINVLSIYSDIMTSFVFDTFIHINDEISYPVSCRRILRMPSLNLNYHQQSPPRHPSFQEINEGVLVSSICDFDLYNLDRELIVLN